MNVFTKLDPEEKSSFIYHLPSLIWRPIFRLILEVDERNVKGDDVTLKELMPTLKFDVQLVNETEGKLDSFKKVQAEVLLLNGSKSPIFLKNSINALKNVLPRVKHVELLGLDHDSAQNYGKPEIIAKEINSFYKV